jgi:hypothetical protein
MKPHRPVAAVLSALITVTLFQGVASLARPTAEAALSSAATHASSAGWHAEIRAADAPTQRN